MEDSKKFYESKLFWLGVIQFAIPILNELAGFLDVGLFSPASIALFMSGVFTIVLRIWFTDKAIA